jgi:hemerythrin
MQIKWTTDFELGIKIIDQQHFSLVQKINAFGTAMLEGRGHRELIGLFSELADYVNRHFSTEEKLMDEHTYPGAELHKSLHKEFTGQLAEFILEYKEGGLMTPSVHRYLREWLSDHILDHSQNADRKLADFLLAEGVR